MVDQIFSLDIGTRSVTGIILEKADNAYSLVDYYVEEHRARSMHDGQIHHVLEVANVINNVKKALELKHGPLHKVCIAAAGRSLKTIQSSSFMSLDNQAIKDEQVIKHLELSAVQEAQKTLMEEHIINKDASYYCVGYSVLHYELDGIHIGSLIDQIGYEARVEIIATFLPKMVIESLLAAIERANLEMDALTLEPIAAIDVLIPQSMRKLNVALVDIGAGTSDIALTNQGTVVAYGMVPTAGDEITEAISDYYLLDFPVAEQTKKNIVHHHQTTVTDILGFESQITYDNLIPTIIDKVDELAQTIADEIINLNAKPPQAVMLVGGGSLTPELTNVLAGKLKLPSNRVAIRDITAINQLNKDSDLPMGPDFVTPIGIAIAAKQNPIHYINVLVNNNNVRMFQLKQLTVGDALIHAGLKVTDFYGKPGSALFIKVNNKDITLPGSYGTAPQIQLNEETATIDSHIKHRDHISIEKGSGGNPPEVTVNELFGEIPSVSFFMNQKAVKMKSSIYVSNKLVDEHYLVKDKDIIELRQMTTIKDFLTINQTNSIDIRGKFMIYVDHRPIYIDAGETHIILNGKKVPADTPLKDNDQLNIKKGKQPKMQDVLDQLNETYWHIIHIQFNDKPVTLKQPRLKVTRDNTKLTTNSSIFQHDELSIEQNNSDSFIFQDVFRYVDLDLTRIKGKFILLKNEQPTSFDDPISDGDQLCIKWTNN